MHGVAVAETDALTDGDVLSEPLAEALGDAQALDDGEGDAVGDAKAEGGLVGTDDAHELTLAVSD